MLDGQLVMYSVIILVLQCYIAYLSAIMVEWIVSLAAVANGLVSTADSQPVLHCVYGGETEEGQL